MIVEKKEMLGVKVASSLKEKLQTSAAAEGLDLSEYVRKVLVEHFEQESMKLMIAEALVVLLACQGKQVNTEGAVKLTRELYLQGAFKESLS